MYKILVSSKKVDSSDKIEDLINFLIEAKELGATHYCMEWMELSGDPMRSYKWLRTYQEPTEEELRLEKIKKLEEELRELKK